MISLLQLERHRNSTRSVRYRLLLPALLWLFFGLQILYMVKYRWAKDASVLEQSWQWAQQLQRSQQLPYIFSLWIGYEAYYFHRHYLWGRYAASGLTWTGRAWWQVLMVITRAGILLMLHSAGLPLLGWVFGLPPGTVLASMQWEYLMPQAVHLLLVGLLSCVVVNVGRHPLALAVLLLYLVLEQRLWEQLRHAFGWGAEVSWLPAAVGQRLTVEYPSMTLVLSAVGYTMLFILLNSWFLRRTPL